MQKSLISKSLLVLMLCLLGVASSFGQKRYTIKSYIEQHKKVAQELMEQTGVPASVILAVAMHESAYGNSRIAVHLNNHFGIKGKNNSKKIKSAYKGYASVKASYLDFVGLLKRRRATSSLFSKYAGGHYKAWVNAIASSGYSRSKSWKSRVLHTIDTYHLDQYDNI